MEEDVPEKMRVGKLGETQVSEALQQVNWAPAAKIELDTGDDLFSFARVTVPKADLDDASGSDVFDVSVPLVLQVKSSRTKYLKTTKRRGDGALGWWYTEESKGHFDHWVNFGLPYFLVFQDVENRISYWALVDGQSIVKTPMGRKIWVPVDQTISPDCLDTLTKAVLKHREDASSGSWSGRMSSLPPGQRLRHALVVPRLVAPHPNRLPAAVSSEEAVALLLLDRGSDLHEYVRGKKCPHPDKWRPSKEWGWRFAGCFVAALDGDPSPMRRLAKTAPSRPERDAALVVAGCSSFVFDDAKVALKAFVPERYSRPADRGWLMAQRAHMLFESGDSVEAAKAARKALQYLAAGGGDVTVAALRAGCASVLYAASEWNSADFDSALAAQENMGTLWRAQAVSTALARDLDDRFREWSGEKSFRVVSSTAFTNLTAAAWNAAFSGSWGTWRDLTGQAARVSLARSRDGDDVQAALGVLVRSGHKKQAKAAARRVWLSGPLDALHATVSSLASEPWPLRAEGAVFAVLSQAGDLLTQAAADAAVTRILDLVRTDGPVRRLGNGMTYRWSEIDSALGRLLDAASTVSHQACAEVVCSDLMNGVGKADELVRLAGKIRMTDLSEDLLERLMAAAMGRTDFYRVALLEIMGKSYTPAVDAIRQLDEDGDPSAGRALLVSGETSKEQWAALGRRSVKEVRKMIAETAGTKGSRAFTFGGPHRLHDLTLAAFYTGNTQHWKAVTDALAAGTLQGSDLAASLGFLSRHFQTAPSSVQARLRKLAPGLKCASGFGLDRDDFDAGALALKVASGVLPAEDLVPELLALKDADQVGFVQVLEMAPTAQNEAFLVSSMVDPEAEVRAYAGFGLVGLAKKSPRRASDIAKALLAALEVTDGARMPVAVAQALAESEAPDMDPVRDLLRNHQSATVRNRLN